MPNAIFRDAYGGSIELDTDDPERLAAVVASGFHPETAEQARDRVAREQQQTPLRIAQTAAEGVARGLTLGGADALAGLVAPEYAKEMQLRREVNPYTAIAGDVVGSIVPILATAGEGAAVRAGVEGLALAREAASGARLLDTAASVARWSPAGLAMRTGEGVSSLVGRGLPSLGITGESLGGRMVGGALRLGAGGAAETAIQGASQAFSQSVANQDWDHIGEATLAGAKEGALLGAVGGGIIGAGLPLVGAAGRKAMSLVPDNLAQQVAEENTAKALGARGSEMRRLEQGGDRLARMNEVLDERGLIKAGETQATEEMMRRVDGARQEVGETIGRFRRDVDDLAQKQNPNLRPDLQPVMVRLDDMTSAAFGADSMATDVERREVKRAFDAIRPLVDRYTSGRGVAFAELDDFIKKLDDEIWTRPKAGGPSVQREDTNLLYDLRRELRSVHDEALTKAVESNPQVGNVETYRKAMRDYGALRDASDVLHKRVPELSGNSFFSLNEGTAGSVAGGIASAAGVVSMLADGVNIADLAISGGVGLATKYGTSLLVKQVERRANTALAVAANKILRSQEAMSRGVAEFISQATVRASRPARLVVERRLTEPTKREKRDDFQATMKRVNEAKVTASRLATSQDPLELAIGKRQVTAIRYLEQTQPVAMRPRNPFSKANPTPNPVDVARWQRRVAIVDRPLSIIDHMKAGTLTSEHVDALRTVYPRIYGDLRDTVERQVNDARTPFDPSSQAVLRTLFGLSDPKWIADRQAVFSPPSQQTGPQQPSQAAPQASAPRLGSLMQTDLQRVSGA